MDGVRRFCCVIPAIPSCVLGRLVESCTILTRAKHSFTENFYAGYQYDNGVTPAVHLENPPPLLRVVRLRRSTGGPADSSRSRAASQAVQQLEGRSASRSSTAPKRQFVVTREARPSTAARDP